ncbi:casein kinase II beta chain [Filobasidium floriforme]|uniref:casein kinase II beta chain n=1 Tax=Filobasidium floriforme TaxID=5210 RepID=UPI001E8DBCCC|nr:casein kinase II beta chain [Filobasidium floriforme]KAH8084711.1 casein kinase II beta chain [Filobasidium floriforme]
MDPNMDAMSQDADMMEEEPEYASSSQGSSSQTSTLTWINWFISLPGHDYYCEVDEDYIEDDFNLTGLQSQVPFWKEALEMVLDVEPEEDTLTIPDVSIIESSAELLYGLVHQRFILTKAGLQAMADRFEQSAFGICPRVYCQGQPVIPCGRVDTPGIDTVKLFCPNCQDIYGPMSTKYSGVDGAFFGTTFPTLFFQTYPAFLSMPFKGFPPPLPSPTSTSATSAQTPSSSASTSSKADANTNPSPIGPPEPQTNPDPYGGQKLPSSGQYVPRIYGFKVSERARSGPRMAWLRNRPDEYDDLAKVDWRGRWLGSRAQAEEGRGGSVVIEKTGESGALFEEDEVLVKSDNEEEEEEEQ